jgi:hypothetical protein
MLQLLAIVAVAFVVATCGGGGGSTAMPSPKVFKQVMLSGAQVVPAVTTAAIGSGQLAVDPSSGALSGSITIFGFTPTEAHVQSGAVGANGAKVADLTMSSTGIWSVSDGAMLTSDQVDAFKNGNLYVVMSSAAHSSGEIRGQVGRLVYYATLSGSQEVPANASTATGTGIYVLDPETKTLSGTTTSTVTGILAHIHTGAIGVSAGVTLPFTGGPTTWNLAPVVLTDAQLTSLQSGNFYANVHSTAFPGGEIRGQVYQPAKTANLTGAQETPPNTSTATGTGTLVFNPFTREVAGRIETQGITGILAHAHQAASGTPGGVVIPMTQSSATSGIWTTAPGATATDAVFLGFIQGNLYLNVHSTAFPGGEIRGQLVQGQ